MTGNSEVFPSLNFAPEICLQTPTSILFNKTILSTRIEIFKYKFFNQLHNQSKHGLERYDNCSYNRSDI